MICSPPSVWQTRHSASSCSVGPAGAERGPRAAVAATFAKASAAAGAETLLALANDDSAAAGAETLLALANDESVAEAL